MTGSQWRDMFEQPGRPGSGPAAGVPPAPAPPVQDDLYDDAPALDMTVYQPWVLQRGRTRPAMMLQLRRFEPRSGMWTGWALPYPNLMAVEYVGDRLMTLDFGTRQFAIQGVGLDQVLDHLQRGAVIAMHEHSSAVWGQAPIVPVISSIRCIGIEERHLFADG